MSLLSSPYLVFQRLDGRRLKITAPALKRMVAYLQLKNADCEAGGVLLGRLLLDSNDVVVDEVTVPMPGDKRSRFSFYRDKRRHQRIINQRWQESKGTCIYLGEWHTHPEIVPTPSRIDLTDWQRKLKVDRFDNDLFFLILGTTEARMWSGSKRCRVLNQLVNTLPTSFNKLPPTMTSLTNDPQLFTLIRHSDETGLSGTGRILDGVIFHTGQVVVCWRTNLNTEQPGFSSLSVYSSWEAFKHIHIDAHPPAQTEIQFGTATNFLNLKGSV